MYHIFHHNKDKDGWCCAYLFHRFFNFYPMNKRKTNLLNPERKYLLYPHNYGDTIPDLKNQEIVFADLSPSRQDAERLLKDGNKIIIIDHHKTAFEALKDLDITYVFNNDYAACILVWEVLFSDPIPKIVLYIADADLYKFALPRSKEINEVIKSYGDDPVNFDYLMSVDLDSVEITHQSNTILRVRKQYIETALKTQHCLIIKNRKIAAVCCAVPQLISEIGNILAKQNEGIGCVYFVRFDGQIEVSLRSIGEIDVSEIAKQMGGGGHKNAAGFVWKQPILCFY